MTTIPEFRVTHYRVTGYYPATQERDTLAIWLADSAEEAKRRVLDYFQFPGAEDFDAEPYGAEEVAA